MPDEALPDSLLFVDATNLDRRLYEAFGLREIDHDKLFAKLATGTRLIGTEYCFSYLTAQNDRDRFSMQRRHVEKIRRQPAVTLREGQHRKRPTRCKICHKEYNFVVEKGTDVNLSIHLVRAACHKLASHLIVVTSDSDFVTALAMAKAEGVHVTLALVIDPGASQAVQLSKLTNLRVAASAVVLIDDQFMDGCWK